MENKLNGLNGFTKFRERGSRTDGGSIEYHEHPDTHELIVVRTVCVPNGEDDVDFESEVLAVHPPMICLLSKQIEEITNKIKNL